MRRVPSAWQERCLLGSAEVLRGGHLVYTAPTSGGKSLVADVLVANKTDLARDAELALLREQLKATERALERRKREERLRRERAAG